MDARAKNTIPQTLAVGLLFLFALPVQAQQQPAANRWKPAGTVEQTKFEEARPATRASIVTHAVPVSQRPVLRPVPRQPIQQVQAPTQRSAPEGLLNGLLQQVPAIQQPSSLTTGQPEIQTPLQASPLREFIEDGRTINVPILQPPKTESAGTVKFSARNGLITLVARGGSLNYLLSRIAEEQGLNVIANDAFNARISVTLTDIPWQTALNAILSVNGYTWSQQGNIITITKLDATKMSPLVQGRIVRVFPLNFIAADEVEKVVTGLLSPVGQSFSTAIDPANHRKTRESIVVEDLPEYVARVEQYILEADRAPRQVMVEAHVLQVDLSDAIQHGVNFQQLAEIANTEIDLQASGFTPGANPALLVGVDGNDLDGVLEALKSTTNAKTLASPKVLVLNGQESRIQIGGQLGFLQSTTTETATLQNVQFIEVGVVLSVTPHISNDGRILMDVKPEVSSGRINPDTGLPEEETTEVETTVMLRDGQGMVIGGLIQEEDSDDQAKIPLLGDTPVIGRLFQRRSARRERNEVIIALVPRIVPYDAHYQMRENTEMDRVTTPLMDNRLRRNFRPWEPRLPDAHKQKAETVVPARYQPRTHQTPVYFDLSKDLTQQARDSVRTVHSQQPPPPVRIQLPASANSHRNPNSNSSSANSASAQSAESNNRQTSFKVAKRVTSSPVGKPSGSKKTSPPAKTTQARKRTSQKRPSFLQRVRSSRIFRGKEKSHEQ